jgi:protein-disulfide isomerase
MPRLRPLASLVAAGLMAAAAGGARAAAEAMRDDDMALGSPQAAVTVIEYASPTCPHCARFNAQVFPAFKAKYVDTGKVRYVLREFPIHPNLDGVAFLLARCAGGERYFKVLDDVMRAQPEYFADPNFNDVSTRFYNVMMREAASLGMSQGQAMACMSDSRAVDALNVRAAREGRQFDVHLTPTFVINGVKLEHPDTRPVDLPMLDKAIADARARAAPPKLRH